MVNSVSGLQFSFSFSFLQYLHNLLLRMQYMPSFYLPLHFLATFTCELDRLILRKLGLLLYMYIMKICLSDGEEN